MQQKKRSENRQCIQLQVFYRGCGPSTPNILETDLLYGIGYYKV